MILALLIFGVTATSNGEGQPTTASVAESSQTLDNHFSEGRSSLSSVTTEPIETTATIISDHDAQAHFTVVASSSRGEAPNQSSVLVPQTTSGPDINGSPVSLIGNSNKVIEVVGDSCPDGYDELLDEEEDKAPIIEGEETTVAEGNGNATGTGASGDEEAIIEKNATSHSPVMNDVPIDPFDRSFIETVQEVVTESNASEDKEILEEFLAELFRNPEGEPSADPVQTPLAQKPKPLTEEEITERKRRLEIETREKRAEITGRHAQWEVRLEERGKEVQADLLKQVNELRSYVSNDVKSNQAILDLLNGYENEANKAIKGVEVFFEKRIKIGKQVEESVVKTWEEVLRKVEKKFDDKKREVEKEMQEYYQSYLEEELDHASILPLEPFGPPKLM
jgi:hypothetical protein